MKKTDKRDKGVTSYRRDSRTDFILRLMARQEGVSMTHALTRCIEDRAKRFEFDWERYYDESEGVSLLRMMQNPAIRLDPYEAKLKRFINNHTEYFYKNDKVNRTYVELLWPSVTEFAKLWEKQQHENFWIAADEMDKALTKAGVAPPKR
jgi:hypothetical protein